MTTPAFLQATPQLKPNHINLYHHSPHTTRQFLFLVLFLILSSFHLLLPHHSLLSDLLSLLRALLSTLLTNPSSQTIINQLYTSNIYLSKPSQHPKSAIPSSQLTTCQERYRVLDHQQIYTISLVTAIAIIMASPIGSNPLYVSSSCWNIPS